MTFGDDPTGGASGPVGRPRRAKELGIDPQAFRRDVLDRISTHPAKRIDELLPDRWQELRQAGDAGTG